MNFIVSIDVSSCKALVHFAGGGCGKQRNRGCVEDDKLWSRTFQKLGKAEEFAKKTGLSTERCSVCEPEAAWERHLQLPRLDLSEFFDRIQTEVLYLHARWQTHRELFREKSSAMFDAASFAAQMIQICMDDSVIMGICRLVDPIEVGQFETATLTRLVHEVSTEHPNTSDRVNDLLSDILTFTKAIKLHRHNRIAHLRRELMIASPGQSFTLPNIPYTDIDDALRAVVHLLNFVQTLLGDGEMYYDDITTTSGGNVLVHRLNVGVRTIAVLEQIWGDRMSKQRFLDELAIQLRDFGYSSGFHFPEDHGCATAD